MPNPVYSPDLAGIQVGETRISNVEGIDGRLSYRGVSIDELIKKPFVRVVWLVLFGAEPTVEQETSLQSFMALHSSLSAEELSLLRSVPERLHPMLVLQCMLPMIDPDTEHGIDGITDDAQRGLLLASKIPSLLAARHQLEKGKEPIKVNAHLPFHENFLMTFTGRAPTSSQIRMLDVTQILQMEHSFNASTFAGRVCASTLAPIQSSLVAAIATLSGELHGGADQAALEMAERVGTPSAAAKFVADCLADKVKIMGMGHREYKVVDPRAVILKPMAEALCSSGESKNLFDTLVAIEAACQSEFDKKGKQIWANVEFYKGAVFHQLGIPAHYFTSVFAMARVFGYIAHYLEFSANSKLIRPSARYVGV
ncbi:hypothetical protein AB833_17530 [Chromatiales bacterium (ex Bugula neritina AB1)]|nr:hypothetical protein AB833_17530 [Chromatiales bacterium (ex Bugula neritina AB1)]